MFQFGLKFDGSKAQGAARQKSGASRAALNRKDENGKFVVPAAARRAGKANLRNVQAVRGAKGNDTGARNGFNNQTQRKRTLGPGL